MSEHIHCASCGASELGCRDGGCCDDCGHEGRGVVSDEGNIGANVARLRKRAGLSQHDLADAMVKEGRSHWRQNTVSRVETGKQEPTGRDLFYLMRILGPGLLDGTGLEVGMVRPSEMIANITRARLREADQSLESALEAVRTLRYFHDGVMTCACRPPGHRVACPQRPVTGARGGAVPVRLPRPDLTDIGVGGLLAAAWRAGA